MIGYVSGAEHIYIVCGYTDMRKSIDGLAAIVQKNFGLDVFRYFELILTVLPSMEFLTDPDILEELMPWNESVHKICKTL